MNWLHRTFINATGQREVKHLMSKTSWNSFSSRTSAEQWPGIDSMYRLIVVAALRNKQLTHGAVPRIEADPRRHRNTTIALEEVKRGLVSFTITEEAKKNGHEEQPLV
jgi:DNA-directed RNA polymerase omega subunit